MDDKRKEDQGQDSLFGGFGDASGIEMAVLPGIPQVEWDKRGKLAFEREMLGLYVSDHPLFGLEHLLARVADCAISAVTADDTRPEGTTVTIAGMISSVQRKVTRNGSQWAIVSVEDLSGAIDALFFPQIYTAVGHALTEDAVVVVKGRLNRRDEIPTIYAAELTLPDLTQAAGGGPVVLSVASRCTRRGSSSSRGAGGAPRHRGAPAATQTGWSTVMRLDDGPGDAVPGAVR